MDVKSVLFIAITAGSLLMSNTACGQGENSYLLIGWAKADMTPEKPVLVSGQFHARVSEGIMDPITATVLALESVRNGTPAGAVIMVSCDLGSISECLRKAVREKLGEVLPELDPMSVIMNATHTHTAPHTIIRRRYSGNAEPELNPYGVELDVISSSEYVAFASQKIAGAIADAWKSRSRGGIAYGMDYAVVGRNRLISYSTGSSIMYGSTNRPDFSHVEGYEDHSVNILATYDGQKSLTGMVINLACPSQVSESLFQLSADYWHETRQELRRRFGEELFVMSQASAAGDQSPHVLVDKPAEMRMQKLANRTTRQQIACRISDAVERVVPLIADTVEWAPVLAHRPEMLKLPRRLIPESSVEASNKEAEKAREKYEELLKDLEAHPEKKKGKRWYTNISRAYRIARRNTLVSDRFRLQQTEPEIEFEVHVVRLGDIVFATNPFELYIDYGIQIKCRSKAVQTFVIQLAGPGSYLPTERSIKGGAYGAVPTSTQVGPEAGQKLVEWTLKTIDELYQSSK
ncbi:MAG TPA: hypothetical protein PKN36_05130 [bacterium]|nr:hypothetical protein [bacterium]